MNSKPIRVLCVDDHALLIDGLRARFKIEHDIEFVGHLPSADDLLSEVVKIRPDVILLDIEMPGADPFEALADLTRQSPEARVIILSGHVRDGYIDMAEQNGAWGYYSKSTEPDAIIDAIRRVHAGHRTLDSHVARRCQNHDTNNTPDMNTPSRLQQLSPRETQILRMIGEGMTRADIAEALHRSRKTIDTHRMSIMEKLDIHDRGELVRFAIREGLADI